MSALGHLPPLARRPPLDGGVQMLSDPSDHGRAVRVLRGIPFHWRRRHSFVHGDDSVGPRAERHIVQSAVALALAGQRVVLLDVDFRRPHP